MVASLYICNRSFLYNGTDSEIEVVRKFHDFSKLVDRVQDKRFSADNTLFVDKDQFFSTNVYLNSSINDCLNPEHRRVLLRDVLNVLLLKLQKCSAFVSQPNQSLLEFLELEDEDMSCAIVVFNKQDDFLEHKQIFSNIKGWLDFRRSHLRKYPHDVDYFLKEAKCVFPDVVINPDTSSLMEDIYGFHVNNISECLSYLNDKIREELRNFEGDNVAFMSASKPGAMKGSFEGKKKEEFYVSFVYEDEAISFYCEPHLKFNQDDLGHKPHNMRVYFKMPNPDDDKIYVGYIRKHI